MAVGPQTFRLEAVADQDALLAGVRTDADLEAFPYGLMLWPSAIALAEAVWEAGDTLRGTRVLELGCGIGLAGLAAAARGARVTQTDYQPQALELAARAAALNGIDGVARRTGDWRDWPDTLTGFDRVIASDILYERGLHDALTVLLPRLPTPGGEVWIADPLRPQAIDLLDAWERGGLWSIDLQSRTVPWDGGVKEILLARLRPRAR